MTDKKTTLYPETVKIVCNVVNFFKYEKKQHKFTFPVEQVNKRAAAAAGVDESVILYVKNKKRLTTQSDTRISPLQEELQTKAVNTDKMLMTYLADLIKSMWSVRKEVPTLNKILTALNNDSNFYCDRNTLKWILVQQLGYQLYNDEKLTREFTDEESSLTKDHYIKRLRTKYLERIRQNDKLKIQRPVIYLDELWISLDCSISKQNPKNNSQWILMHAGGKMGFLPTAHHIIKSVDSSKDMSGIFLRWLKDKLIPNLPSKSIIVMDNAFYHGVRKKGTIHLNSSKEEMIEWLKKHQIPFENHMSRPQLLEIIGSQQLTEEYVNGILETRGHEVLRLPPYNFELNPIEYVWNIIKQRLPLHTEPCSDTMKVTDILNVMKLITPADWKVQIDLVKSLETEYWQKDKAKAVRSVDNVHDNDVLQSSNAVASVHIDLDDEDE